jgi:hypothetical protein
MNDYLLNISLNQGKQFKQLQQKIKKSNKIGKEGFVSGEQESIIRSQGEGYVPVLQNQTNNLNKTSSVNKTELNDLIQLQQSYQQLLDQYTNINKSITDSSLASINRTSSSNPYLGKNIRFTDGTICYVTSQGIVRKYPTQDIFMNTAGLNGCPAKTDIVNVNIAYSSSFPIGSSIPTTPPLIIGQDMVQNESCGNEGKNVYASTLLNNPTSSYIGCYNDKPPVTNVSIVPLYNSSEWNAGFGIGWSSTYQNNYDLYGGPNVFGQDPNKYWHTNEDSQYSYNDQTGIYQGTGGKSVYTINSGLQTILGENLQVFFPNAGTDNSQKIVLTQYALAPRLDDCCLTTRSPNSWYIAGLKDNALYEVDRQVNQQFTDGNPKSYNVSQPGSYDSYVIIVDKVGNDDKTSNRNSLQIANWTLFSNTNYIFNDDQRAMTWNPDAIGYTTYDNCQKYAVDNGYQYFGLQDYKADGTAACLVSNDLSKSKMYGDGSSQVTMTPLWSSNTQGSGSNSCIVSREGKLQVIGSDGSVKWESPNAPEDCVFGGTINTDTIVATYGANCNNSGASVSTGNATEKTKQMIQATPFTSNFLVTVDNNTFGDPAVGCSKNWDTAYQCGTAWKTTHIDNAEGQSYNYDCITEAQNCLKFYLILQDDGNVCLYRSGLDQSIWCTSTNGKQIGPNLQWSAPNGKSGKNNLTISDVLGPDDWIGSNDGSLKLIMQSDGNLVLYTSDVKVGCNKDSNGQMYGNEWINALYQVGSVGNKSTLGKMGYIDANSNLMEYPDSMIGYSTQYNVFDNTDSGGNDITSLQVTDQNGCQTACNNNDLCAAYVYQETTNSCWIKNSDAYPKGQRQQVNGLKLGVRKLKPISNSSCSNEVIDIDTVMYDNYVKGSLMTPDTQCNQSVISTEDESKLSSIESQLYILGQNIASKMEKLYNDDNTIYEKMNMNSQQFKKNISMYKNTKMKIQQLLQEKQSNNSVEGMTTMSDLNGMLSDTDLRVLQENYKYIFWSILAVSAITITINIMKK